MIFKPILKYLAYIMLILVFTVNGVEAKGTVLYSKCDIHKIIKNSGLKIKDDEIPWQCNVIYDVNKKIDVKKLKDCLRYSPLVFEQTILNGILSCDSSISQEELTSILEMVIESSYYSDQTDFIKKLIDSGASTEKFDARIGSGVMTACETVSVVIEKNKEFYKDEKLLSIKTDGYHSRWLDLHYLTNTVTEYTLCNKAATLLVRINPKLINYQEEYDKSTPLHNYLYDVNYFDWEMGVAKLLMSKENINLQTELGDTALHYLLLYNKESTDKLIELLKTALSLGADLTLKNKDGITVKDLIMKRPDLVSVLK